LWCVCVGDYPANNLLVHLRHAFLVLSSLRLCEAVSNGLSVALSGFYLLF
jgi:hypothetical protein